jgi:hypothetical protein
LSEESQNIQTIGDALSDQGDIALNGPLDGPQKSALSTADRVRALETALQRAEAEIGGQGGPGLRMRAEYILDHAREHKLDKRLYRIAWFIKSTLPA